jgi:integrase
MAPRKNRRRREKGTGSVTFDKTRNKFVARLPETGIGTPPKKQFDTEDAARDWLAQKLRDSADGIAVDNIPTLGQWLTHWHTNIIKVRVTTHEEYGDVIRVRIVPYLGRFGLDELERNPEKIEQWLSQLEKIGYALSPDEAQRLLVAVEGHWLYALYYVALRTGMRMSELIGLRRTNIQLVEKNGKKPHIRVREQIRDVNGVPTVLKTKNKKTRDIPLDDDLIAVLTAHFQLLADERERRSKDWHEQMLVFPSSIGTPLGHNNLRRHYKIALKRAKLPNIRFHDLRHSAGSLMLRSGASLVDVSNILGHSDIAVTARIYIHSYEDTMFAAVASTATILRRAEGGAK